MAAMPSMKNTPSETPTPMPILAPVVNPPPLSLLLALSVATAELGAEIEAGLILLSLDDVVGFSCCSHVKIEKSVTVFV